MQEKEWGAVRIVRAESVEDLARRRMIGAITARKDFWAALEEVVRAAERCGLSREAAVAILLDIIQARMKGPQLDPRPGALPDLRPGLRPGLRSRPGSASVLPR